MKNVYRISTVNRSINLERWSNWNAFDAAPPGRAEGPASLCYVLCPVDPAGDDCVSFELQFIRVNNGQKAAAKALIAQETLLWERHGAKIIGAFEVVHGNDLPAIIVILGWQDLASAASAQSALYADSDIEALYREHRLGSNQAAIRGVGRMFCSALRHEAHP